MMRRAGKQAMVELAEDDVPAAPPLQREEESKNKNKRIQVERRHKMGKMHCGSFNNDRDAKFASDCSLYLKLSCEHPTEKDKYNYLLSPTIFKMFECLPDKYPIVSIYKQLHLQPICGKGKSKDEKFAQFCEAARKQIKEMIPNLRDALLKEEIEGKVSHMDKVRHAKVAVMEQLCDKDWILLGKFMEIFGKGRLVNIILSGYAVNGYSFDHDATSSSQENISAAKTLVLEQIDDQDWLMLRELVSIFGIDYIMFTLCNSLVEVSPFEQDFLSNAHYKMPVHLEERNSGYASLDHAQNSSTCEASARPPSTVDNQVLTMNQLSENLDSGLQCASLKINPKEYPTLSHEDDRWWCKDLE